MPLTYLRACLTLGTLLCALPTLADPPAVPAAASTTQTIVLQHVVPGDILKLLHWDQGANLPPGVTRTSGQPTTNSLSVVATPAGFARLQQIVSALDVAPRWVQIKFALANADPATLDASGIHFNQDAGSSATSPTPLRYATGKDVAALLQTLTNQSAVTHSPVLTTTNNVDASLAFSDPSQPQGKALVTFAVTPRVNGDNSITLALHPNLVFRDGTAEREIRTLRIVKSGDTLVLVLPPAAQNAKGKNLLLFVTPAVAPDGNSPPVTAKQ